MGKVYADFGLDPDMVKQLRKEFDMVKVLSDFIDAAKKGKQINSAGEGIFGAFGQRMMERVLELGEEHSDLIYEEIKTQDKDHHGYYRFPFAAQRFVEITYLSTFPALKALKVVENSRRRLAFTIGETDCPIYAGLKEKGIEEVVRSLPCRHLCLTMLNTLCNGLKVEGIKSHMFKMMPEDKFCGFEIARST